MKVTLVILQSLNGYIAHQDEDKLDWGGKNDKRFFAQATKRIGTMIMGSNTFMAMNKRVLPERKSIVMTSDPEKFADIQDPNFLATNESAHDLIARLDQEGIAEVALIGGGILNATFLNADLIDEVIITIAPAIFQPGKKLFADEFAGLVKLKLLSTEKLDEDTISLHYQVIK